MLCHGGSRVQWFVTLFARVLPAPSVYRIWDIFFVDGWKMVFRVALAITAFIRPHILEMVGRVEAFRAVEAFWAVETSGDLTVKLFS